MVNAKSLPELVEGQGEDRYVLANPVTPSYQLAPPGLGSTRGESESAHLVSG